MKAGSDRSKLPLKAPEGDGEEEVIQGATASLAAANEISVDAAVEAALSELGGISYNCATTQNNTEGVFFV